MDLRVPKFRGSPSLDFIIPHFSVLLKSISNRNVMVVRCWCNKGAKALNRQSEMADEQVREMRNGKRVIFSQLVGEVPRHWLRYL